MLSRRNFLQLASGLLVPAPEPVREGGELNLGALQRPCAACAHFHGSLQPCGIGGCACDRWT